MATLEKIRSKSVLLFVIIIVALLAFILGDFLTSGRTYFGSGTTVAKTGDATVEYEEYKQELERMQNQYQAQGQQADADELGQMVIKSLLYKNMLQKHYDQLGLKVTDAEVTRAMTGAIPHPSAQQFIYQVSGMLQLPEASATAVLDAINNPAKYNLTVEQGEQLKAGWANIENNINDELLYHKYMKLVDGLFQANNLDARSIYDDLSDSRTVAYAAQAVNTVPDDDVEVTEDDIKAQWEKRKNRYALEEETRDVDYIYVAIEPSEADRMAGQKAVEDAMMTLSSGEGLGTVGTDRRFNVRRLSAPLSAISDTRLAGQLKNDTVGAASLYDTQLDSYTMVKLLGKSTGVDSINISVLAFADAAMSDSLLNALEGGAKFADLINGADVQGNDSIWASLVSPGQFTAPVLDMLKAAETGKYYFVNDTTTAQSFPGIYRVNRRNPEVTVYDFAVINYVVDPSAETIAELNNKLNTFLSANSSADDFSAHALESGYSLLSATVSASSPHIADVADSRQAVKWVMDAKKGKVSPIIRDSKQSYLLAIAVKDIFDGDYKPYTASDINSELRRYALNAKKAEKLMEKYKDKAGDVEGYATLMEVPVDSSQAVINAPLLLNLGGNEGYLQGQIAGAPVGKVIGPLAGNSYVMVFKVLSEDKQGRPFEFDEFSARFRQSTGFDNLDAGKIFNILKGTDKIKNNSLNFIQGIDE